MPELPKLKIVLVLSVLLSVAFPVQGPVSAQSGHESDVFTEDAASKLLSQIAEGLQGHSVKKMFAAFDLSRMDGGPIFKEQITAFFNQYDSIRVHFKLVEVKDDVAVVDGEIDATPRDSDSPPEHKSGQLRFTGANTAAGWKFIDVQPRNFFS